MSTRTPDRIVKASVTLVLGEGLLKQLVRIAAAEDRSLSNAVRVRLHRQLEAERKNATAA